ncbi:MAG: polysaccharide deacetylase family protein [Chitinophagaceae bacterium]
MYLVKTPWLLKKIYSKCAWNIDTKEKKIFLTFDDGPHPTATPYVLDLLKQYNAKATFFCIGKNVEENRNIYNRIIEEGHTVGNHTQHHLNGWKVSDDDYINDIKQAANNIDSKLFRPPYGRISHFQIKLLQQMNFKIIMWDVLSGDFDINLSKDKCANNVLLNAKEGSIIVFHDSQKAWERLQYTLPKVLDYFSKNGYQFDRILP